LSSSAESTAGFPGEEDTYWERAARTRWGAYLTEHERETLSFAASAAGEPALAVEVGCEGGRWSKMLHDAGWRMICTDVDRDALAVCQRRIPEATCLLKDPADPGLGIDSGIARLLLVFEVAPVTQQADFPAEAARVLEPGGVLVCSYYNPASARGVAYRALRRLEAMRSRTGTRHFHSDFYNGDSYRSFRTGLQQHGFQVLRESGVSWFPFRRESDSRLIPWCTRLEGLLGLRRLPSLGPLDLVVARKG
jgi:SAM-dependent methyltransferase